MNKLHDEVYTAICNSHHGGGAPPCYRCGDAVSTLDRMGLLATPAMRQCVSALTNIPNGGPGRGLSGKNVYLYFHSSDHAEAFFRSIDVLRAEEAERAPKPRYYAIPEGSDIRVCGCGVMDRDEGNPFYAPGNGFTLKQAEAVADTLNGLERGK